MRTIAIVNQKGGVGKTTTTANLAHALALTGSRVTAIDLDPQGHLTSSFGLWEKPIEGVDEVLLGNADIEDKVISLRNGLRLLPAGSRLGQFEQQTSGTGSGGNRLRDAMTGHFADQDFVLIDCPPASGLLLINALYAVDEVMIPVVGDYLALEGLSHLMGTFANFEQRLGHDLKRWIVLTRFRSRGRLARQVQQKLHNYFPDELLATPVRETIALAECPGFGQTIFEYQRSSAGARDYQSLASDFLDGRVMQ